MIQWWLYLLPNSQQTLITLNYWGHSSTVFSTVTVHLQAWWVESCHWVGCLEFVCYCTWPVCSTRHVFKLPAVNEWVCACPLW